jgi:hypothetical protein
LKRANELVGELETLAGSDSEACTQLRTLLAALAMPQIDDSQLRMAHSACQWLSTRNNFIALAKIGDRGFKQLETKVLELVSHAERLAAADDFEAAVKAYDAIPSVFPAIQKQVIGARNQTANRWAAQAQAAASQALARGEHKQASELVEAALAVAIGEIRHPLIELQTKIRATIVLRGRELYKAGQAEDALTLLGDQRANDIAMALAKKIREVSELAIQAEQHERQGRVDEARTVWRMLLNKEQDPENAYVKRARLATAK